MAKSSKKSDEQLSTSNIETSFAALNKKHGGGLDKPPAIEPVSSEDVLPTPSVALNLLCGPDHGIRKGSIVHWYGPESSLKTWLGLEMCREAQIKWEDKIVAVIDTEFRIDMYQATNLIGVNVEPFDTGVPRFIYRRPHTAEEAWELIGDFAASGHFSFILLDSNSTMRSKAVYENPEFSLGQVGSAARINSAALQKYAPTIAESGTILWAVSQMRIVSMMPVVTKGPTGGAAWNYYATHEFKCERVAKERESSDQDLQIFAKKMKWSQSLRECEVPIIMGHGVNKEKDIINVAIDLGIMEQNSSWIKYKGENIGQGKDKSAEVLLNNPDLSKEVLDAIYSLDQ